MIWTVLKKLSEIKRILIFRSKTRKLIREFTPEAHKFLGIKKSPKIEINLNCPYGGMYWWGTSLFFRKRVVGIVINPLRAIDACTSILKRYGVDNIEIDFRTAIKYVVLHEMTHYRDDIKGYYKLWGTRKIFHEKYASNTTEPSMEEYLAFPWEVSANTTAFSTFVPNFELIRKEYVS